MEPSTVAVVAAVSVLTLIAGLSVLQLALAAGAPWGRLAWGGRFPVLPPALRLGSVVAVLIHLVTGTVLASRAGLVSVLPASAVTVLAWVVTATFALGVLTNLASRSRPERLVMIPLSLALTAGGVVICLT